MKFLKEAIVLAVMGVSNVHAEDAIVTKPALSTAVSACINVKLVQQLGMIDQTRVKLTHGAIADIFTTSMDGYDVTAAVTDDPQTIVEIVDQESTYLLYQMLESPKMGETISVGLKLAPADRVTLAEDVGSKVYQKIKDCKEQYDFTPV